MLLLVLLLLLLLLCAFQVNSPDVWKRFFGELIRDASLLALVSTTGMWEIVVAIMAHGLQVKVWAWVYANHCGSPVVAK